MIKIFKMSQIVYFRKILLVIIVMVFTSGNLIHAQETQNIGDSRREHIRKLLDYRYRGGFYSFERLFNSMVKYSEEARVSCAIGIVVVSFEVSCTGEFEKLTIKNAIRFGLDKQLEDFFNATIGEWNKCNDDRYTRFEVPIQFTIENVETNSTDAALVVTGTHQGYPCNGDDYYIEKADKLLEKGRGKKALEYIDVLIQRNPYSTEYYDLKKKALEMGK